MSDYHLDELYAGCQQALQPLAKYAEPKKTTEGTSTTSISPKPYYWTHPQYSHGGDLTSVKFAYVQIAYKCTRYQGEGGNSIYGWAILNNFTPAGLGSKPQRCTDGNVQMLRFSDYQNGPGIFKKGNTLVGCWLVFTSKGTHTINGSLPMWSSPNDSNTMCPPPNADGSTEEGVVVYTSPVISIEGQCREWATYNHLLKAWDKKAATYRYNNAGKEMPPEQYQAGLGMCEKLANRYAFRLRKYLYSVLCPCHTCTDIDKGSHIAWNNCVPCLCKPKTTHSCWDPQSSAFVPCPTQDKYNIQVNKQCIKCKPAEIWVARHGRLAHETFCPNGTICKTVLKMSTMSSCQFGGTLVPVFDPTCIKVADVKKLITEVNSLVHEAHTFRRAYLNKNPDGKFTMQVYERKSGGLFPSEDKLVAEEVYEDNPAYKPWTDKMKQITLSKEIQFKTITTTCPPLVTTWSSTAFSLMTKQFPEEYKTTTVSFKVVKFPPECTCASNDPFDCDTICMCDSNQCIPAKEMHSILVKVSTKLEEMLQSMCLPYRMVARKTFTNPLPPETPVSDQTATCAAHKCLTTFPKNCNCIRKPIDGTPITDTSIWKCGHVNTTLPNTTTYIDSYGTSIITTSNYMSHDIDCCGITWPCTEDWFKAGHHWTGGVPYDEHIMWYQNIWLYKGWQMMGQVSLSDYIKKYFGYSWNPVPSCCHGTDCLSQWHFEILWRITQALLRGHYDQYQGAAQQINVIYRFGMCGPPDCGDGYFRKRYLKWETAGPATIDVDYPAVVCSSNPPIVESAVLHPMSWDLMGLHGKLIIEGTKYWLKRSAKPYNRSYIAINVPEGSDIIMEPLYAGGLSAKLDPSTSKDPVIQFQLDTILLMSTKWYMKDQQKDWDKTLLDKAVLSGKDVHVSDKSKLLVSFVVDGLVDVDQLNELIDALGIAYSHRIWSLLLHVDRLRDKALRENDGMASQGVVVNRKELETVVADYMNDTMRLGSSLMTPDILYDNRNELVKAFPEESDFWESVDESNSPSNESCTSCRLNRIKGDMYQAFIKTLYTLLDDDRMKAIAHWTDVLPTVNTLRVVNKLKYSNVGRHELVPKKYKDGRKIVLDVQMAIGDVLAATATVKTLKKLHPGYRVWVTTSCPDVWKNNPLVEKGEPPEDAVKYVLGCPTSANQHSKNSFIQQYWKALHMQLFEGAVDFSQAEAKPDLYLSRVEKFSGYPKAKFGISKPYWIVVCGYKSDHPLKHWGALGDGSLYQKVINATPDIRWVQMGKNDDDHHTHIPLQNTINMLGHTNHQLRDVIMLIAHAEGVLCPNTCYQHIAAAFPHVRCITVGGAREPRHWLDYSGSNDRHVYINTIGELPCSSAEMCKEPGVHFNNTCSNKGEGGMPKCMEMITPEQVVEWIRKLT